MSLLLSLLGSGASYVLTADYGAFSVSGQDAGIYAGYALNAEYGAFSINGKDIALPRKIYLDAGYGAFAINGQDAFPARGPRYMVAGLGTFAVTPKLTQISYVLRNVPTGTEIHGRSTSPDISVTSSGTKIDGRSTPPSIKTTSAGTAIVSRSTKINVR
jgi:hypothetical protein